jgi:uncharacterized protein (UPF0548 family)
MRPGPGVEELRQAHLTYAEVGLTRGSLPSGYHHLRRSVVVGVGADRFEEAARAVLSWEMHRRAGLSVRSSSESVVEGAVAVLRLGRGPLGVNAPVRVVYMVDEPRRKGFAYGTLPGHPESGEEAFVVELQDDDVVMFTISAFSRPRTLPARACGPISRGIQSWVTRRYLRAL